MWEKVKATTEWDGCWFCSNCYSMNHYTEKAWQRIGTKEKLCEKCKKSIDNNSKV